MFLRDIWYFGERSAAIKPGDMIRREILDQPILLGRTRAGKAFAMRDICPHRAVPLSAGRLVDTGDTVGGEAITEPQVECPYHGWRFGQAGICRRIPSQVEGQEMDLDKIKVPIYPVHEANGVVWIFIPRQTDSPIVGDAPVPHIDPPQLPAVGADWQPKFRMRMIFDCHIDHAVIGLMDPAHVSYVHRQWWWRSENSMYAKEKNFGPAALGFSMLPHTPSSNSFAYKWLFGANPTTEIVFRLPGIRTELITAGKTTVLGLTCVTPLSETQTEVTQLFYWNNPLFTLAKPLLKPFAEKFLDQDRQMVMLQGEGLKYDPRLMLINDTDVQAKWYFRLKKEWQASLDEAREFANPVEEVVLRWRS